MTRALKFIILTLLAPTVAFGQGALTGRAYPAASPNAHSQNIGINVNAQTGAYSLVCSNSANTDRFGEVEFNISSATTLTVPQAGANDCTSGGFSFIVRNDAASTATLSVTATTSQFVPENVATIKVDPGGALFVYSETATTNGAYHAIPISSTGGTTTKTASYTLTANDRGKLVIMNCSTSCTLTMPASPPSSTWYVRAISIGSSTATVSLNSLTLNGASTVPTMNSTNVFTWVTDGSNYFGDVSFGSGGGGGGVNTCGSSGTYIATYASTTTVGCSVDKIDSNGNMIVPAPSGITAGTTTSGNLATLTASQVIGNCTVFPCAPFGVFINATGGYVVNGFATVNLDATVNVTYGDNLCASSSGATAHDNGVTPCPTGLWVGVASATVSSVSSSVAYLEMR